MIATRDGGYSLRRGITEEWLGGNQSRSAPVTARLWQLNTVAADLPLLLAAEDRYEKDMLPLVAGLPKLLL